MSEPLVLRLGDRVLDLGARPLLMGIVNATPDSFSDAGDHPTRDGARGARGRAARRGRGPARRRRRVGARRPADAAAAEEIARVVPLIERLAGELGAVVSVDTYKPEVAEAAIAAGAMLVNDVSGLRDLGIGRTCARAPAPGWC